MEFKSERVLGEFPLSIPTSIAFEYLLGIKSEANPEPKLSNLNAYKEVWINIRTLFRNLISSLQKENTVRPNSNELADVLIHEIEVISGIISDASYGTTRCIFYVSNYSNLEFKYKNAIIRKDNTDKQKHYTQLQTDVISKVLKGQFSADICLKVFDLKLTNDKKIPTLILTHIPYDLVSSKVFGKLELLESHTGAIKSRDKWHTKYFNGSDLSMIPFIEMLLPIFGDKETFKPMLGSARNDIVSMAKKYNWSSVTTPDKVLYGIRTLKNKFLEDTILSYHH